MGPRLILSTTSPFVWARVQVVHPILGDVIRQYVSMMQRIGMDECVGSVRLEPFSLLGGGKGYPARMVPPERQSPLTHAWTCCAAARDCERLRGRDHSARGAVGG